MLVREPLLRVSQGLKWGFCYFHQDQWYVPGRNLRPQIGLSCLAPHKNRDTRGWLPTEALSKGLWPAEMVATWICSVAGVKPVEMRSWRNSSTEPTGQLTGFRWRCSHHDKKSRYFRAYRFLVEGALELKIVSTTLVERTVSMSCELRGQTHKFPDLWLRAVDHPLHLRQKISLSRRDISS